MDSGAAGLELMIKGFVSARQQIAFMEQGGYSEIMSQLRGQGWLPALRAAACHVHLISGNCAEVITGVTFFFITVVFSFLNMRGLQELQSANAVVS